jgi:hypothetical protein
MFSIELILFFSGFQEATKSGFVSDLFSVYRRVYSILYSVLERIVLYLCSSVEVGFCYKTLNTSGRLVSCTLSNL